MVKEQTYDYNWLHFSQAYFKAAKLCCETFVGFMDDNDYIYQDLWLVLPIFYNTKHGIEIFTKTINQFIDGQYDNNSHDIKELFKKLKQKIKKLKIQPLSDKKGNKITKSDIKNFSKNIDNLEKLIYKFYKVEILENKLENNVAMFDNKNDLFRFPDSKAVATINWENIIDKFLKPDILKVKKEIEGLETLFNKVGYIIVCAIK